MLISRALLRLACSLGLCVMAVAGNSGAFAAQGIVLGDSIGVGVSMASGLPRLAHNSVTIRSANAIEQIRRTPRDTVAFLSLGTNDAVGSIAGVASGIDRIVAAAQKANINLVWIGPPCVRKAWNANVIKLDEMLREQLAGRVRYVSVADQGLCDPNLRAGDGVHFNMRGYQILWSKARAVADVAIDTPPADVDPGAATKKSRTNKHKTAQETSHPPRSPQTAERSADGGGGVAMASRPAN